VFNNVAGATRVYYIGWYIRDAQRHRQVPRLTSDQFEALELIESIINDPEMYLEMQFEPGDIQFLSNANILHSREAYLDHSEPKRRKTKPARVARRRESRGVSARHSNRRRR
jgi:Taurine catabolism dioxygenase TauD, TfdA family